MPKKKSKAGKPKRRTRMSGKKMKRVRGGCGGMTTISPPSMTLDRTPDPFVDSNENAQT